jgi:hypothetical protein
VTEKNIKIIYFLSKDKNLALSSEKEEKRLANEPRNKKKKKLTIT